MHAFQGPPRAWLRRWLVCGPAAAQIVGLTMCASGQAIPGRPFSATGTVVAVDEGLISIETDQGRAIRLRFPATGDGKSVQINGKYQFRVDVQVAVAGDVDLEYLAQGRTVELNTRVTRLGRIPDELETVKVIDSDMSPAGVTFSEADDAAGASTRLARIVGAVERLRGKRLLLRVPAGPGAPKGRIVATLSADARVHVVSRRIETARPGDAIQAEGLQFEEQDVMVQQCRVKLAPRGSDHERSDARDGDASSDSDRKRYARLSDAPGRPRRLRSRNFLLHTDLSERSATELLDKLETMRGLIVAYFGRQQRGLIECYVVRDIDQWAAGTFPPDAEAKIREPAGVTITTPTVVGKRATLRTIAYSCDDHRVAQHEAVHAFCRQAFGDVGPSWYAEGMAEMGQYWKRGQRAVDIRLGVARYLTTAQAKPLLEIVNPREPPGTWQDYAWRWALCHLLEGNPNYSPRFKRLGIALMEGSGASFEATYGPVAREIAFEYDFFIHHLGNGYRVDLTAWDWKARFRPLGADQRRKAVVRAERGWQPSSIQVVAGKQYAITAQGTWSIGDGAAEVDADGDDQGHGRLLGAILSESATGYALGSAFELGKRSRFTPPGEGRLYLRCGDAFTGLADNRGEITVNIAIAEPSTAGSQP